MSESTQPATQPESAESAPVVAPKRRWGRRLFAFAVVLVLGLVGVSAMLFLTGRGQRIALDVMLDRARATLAGDLVVDGIRSVAGPAQQLGLNPQHVHCVA